MKKERIKWIHVSDHFGSAAGKTAEIWEYALISQNIIVFYLYDAVAVLQK